MQLSESKLFTIEALNRIEGFVWPEGAAFATHGAKSKNIVFWNEFYGASFLISKLSSDFISGINSLITKAEFDSVDGWVRNDGDKPYNKMAVIDVDILGGSVTKGSATSFCFDMNNDVVHKIVKWRYHKPAKETIMQTTKPACIETLISKRKDALDQKRLALVALEEAEAAEHGFMLAIEEWAESHGFDIRLLDESEENPESELVITDWRDLRAGDVIEIKGCERVLTGVRNSDYGGEFRLSYEIDGWEVWSAAKWKFIRRPQ